MHPNMCIHICIYIQILYIYMYIEMDIERDRDQERGGERCTSIMYAQAVYLHAKRLTTTQTSNGSQVTRKLDAKYPKPVE